MEKVFGAEEIQSAVNAVIVECGQVAMRYYMRPIETSTKSDTTIVSEADIEIEKTPEDEDKELDPQLDKALEAVKNL